MVSDVQAIDRAIADYAFYLDTFQIEKVLEIWHDDAIFALTPIGEGILNSKKEIEVALREFFATVTQWAHTTGNRRIDMDGDEATATSHVHFNYIHRDGRRREGDGYWSDEWIRTESGWEMIFKTYLPLLTDNENLIRIAEAQRRGMAVHPLGADRPQV